MPETAYVNLHAPINHNTAQNLMALCGQLVGQGKTEICLMLSSPGGSVASGFTLYNFLMSLPIKLTTHNIGNVDSIGNVIFLAGETRRACKHSTFMFHGAGIDVERMRFEEKNLREALDSLVADQKRMADLISSRSSLDAERARELFREAQTKDADMALTAGIVHEICDLTIPSGAQVLTLVVT